MLFTSVPMPGKEFEPRRESQPDNPFVRAARYVADAEALAAYTQAQETIFGNDCDLSAYRIRYVNVPYVVVLGQVPPQEIGERLDGLLASGEPANLPQDILKTLSQRRAQAQRLGPWVEGHYRPGRHDLG
jgi:hypothetical protein